MYGIGYVIYGIPLNSAIHSVLDSILDEDPEASEDIEDYGFTTFYHGSARFLPGYCGVRLGTIDEMQPLDVSDLPVPTELQKKQAEASIDDLRPEFKAVAPKIGTWIVWGTS